MLLLSCPNRHQTLEVQHIHTFIKSLDIHLKLFLDSNADGQTLKKTYIEMALLLNMLTTNNLEWTYVSSRGAMKKVIGMLEIDE